MSEEALVIAKSVAVLIVSSVALVVAVTRMSVWEAAGSIIAGGILGVCFLLAVTIAGFTLLAPAAPTLMEMAQ